MTDLISNPSAFDVIVTSHNNLPLTSRCLTTLYANTSAQFHCTVVDDSTDLTPQWVEQFAKEKGNVTYLGNQGKTFKNSNHIWREALDHVTNPIVVFLTNSAYVEPEWEVYPLDIMKNNPKVGVVGIKLLNPSGPIWHAGVGFNNSYPFHIGIGDPAHWHTHIRQMQCINPSVGFYRREALINALDVDTYIGWRGFEDTDQCLMLRNNGWTVVYCGFSSAYHIESPTRLYGADTDQNKFWEEYNENFRRFIMKWEGRQDLLGSGPG